MRLEPDMVQEPVPFQCHPTLGFYPTLDIERMSFHSFSLINQLRSGSIPRTHLCICCNYKCRKCNSVVMLVAITLTLSMQYLVIILSSIFERQRQVSFSCFLKKTNIY